MVAQFVPDRGDFVWIDFDPQSGHEQKGKRPALVISPKNYNRTVGLCLLCPITNQSKGYPFEVYTESKIVSGVILSDHIKSLDWKARKATFIAKASASTINDVLAKLNTLL